LKFYDNRQVAIFGRFCAIAILLFALGACGTALRWVPEDHVVQPGETLFSIAWYYQLDYKELARWNRLGDGSVIRAGQKIRLSPPQVSSGTVNRKSPAGSAAEAGKRPRSQPAQVDVPPPRVWRWPLEGKIVTAFGRSPQTQSGIQIEGKIGQSVVAAANGVVVYAGSGLAGYSQLLIVKHNTTYLSAYGHNDSLLVKEGEQVQKGQRIARVGRGPAQRPMLHFEIRKNGQPVDPVRYLPNR